MYLHILSLIIYTPICLKRSKLYTNFIKYIHRFSIETVISLWSPAAILFHLKRKWRMEINTILKCLYKPKC